MTLRRSRAEQAATHGPLPSLTSWISACRPKTLAAGVVPIALGSCLPLAMGQGIDAFTAVTCLIACLLLQIGCNFINDAADGDRGTDAERIGPQRAVAAGLISSRAMWTGGLLVLALAFLCGLYLSWLGGWPIFALGIFSLLGAIAYTAGPAPLAYLGLGDLFVFIFFGIIAVMGSG